MDTNSTWVLFVITAFGLTVILALIVIFPWLRRGESVSDVNSTALNISMFKKRLAELEEDALRKAIENDEYLAQKIDLQRQLLAASSPQATTQLNYVSTELGHASSQLPRRNVLVVFVSIPVLCFSTYFFSTQLQKSQHRALMDFWAHQDQYAAVADDVMTGKRSQLPVLASNQLFALLQSMQVNAYQHPFDVKRWSHLSEIYMHANAIEPALTAAEHAYRLQPKDKETALVFAQLRVTSSDGKVDRKTQEIVASILRQHPEDERALLIMSMAAYQNQQFSEAIDCLKRLKRARLARATISQPVNATMIAQLDQTIQHAEKANEQLIQSSSDRAVSKQ